MKERRCPQCGRWIKHLGVASHRAMHYRQRIKQSSSDSEAIGVRLDDDNYPHEDTE